MEFNNLRNCIILFSLLFSRKPRTFGDDDFTTSISLLISTLFQAVFIRFNPLP